MKYLIILFALILVACGDKVSVSTLEQQKQIAIDNSLFNAQEFRAKDPRLVNYKIISAPDSSQLPECPQGDGWATLELINADSNDKEKIKCSTYSKATGCFYDRDFKQKSYANDDGHCQPQEKVPYPLPKITQ